MIVAVCVLAGVHEVGRHSAPVLRFQGILLHTRALRNQVERIHGRLVVPVYIALYVCMHVCMSKLLTLSFVQ